MASKKRRFAGSAGGKGSRDDRSSSRKTLQLCGQVARTLNQVLPDLDDDLLRNLQVVAVHPLSGAGHLLVSVEPVVPLRDATIEQVQSRLQSVAGNLRAEVAASITRRQAPALHFQVLPASLAVPPPPNGESIGPGP